MFRSQNATSCCVGSNLRYREKGKQTLPSNNKNSKSVDERLALMKDEIHQVIQNVPSEFQSCLTFVFQSEIFKFATVQRLQSDFEAKVGEEFEKLRTVLAISIVIKSIFKDL